MSWDKRTPKHGGYYFPLEVETFRPTDTNGRHGKIHVRPLLGQGYEGWFVQCSRKLIVFRRLIVERLHRQLSHQNPRA